MFNPQNIAIAFGFIPVAIAITYMDVRYRRIPNKLVLLILIAGITSNTLFGGWRGLLASLGGLFLAFAAMFFWQLQGLTPTIVCGNCPRTGSGLACVKAAPGSAHQPGSEQ